jgi:hypothetical protein
MKEITREYRLDFTQGEAHWDDPIPPEVTSQVLGKQATCIISRTSLLSWSLMMNIREVEVADVTVDGWIQIAVRTGPDFDEKAFGRSVAETMAEVKQVRSQLSPKHGAFRRGRAGQPVQLTTPLASAPSLGA